MTPVFVVWDRAAAGFTNSQYCLIGQSYRNQPTLQTKRLLGILFHRDPEPNGERHPPFGLFIINIQ
jgi:hypothetical protein